tara:strand:- start:364 stop:564 length:201 start_codon:yes stop_codon:yes gene_type:complete
MKRTKLACLPCQLKTQYIAKPCLAGGMILTYVCMKNVLTKAEAETSCFGVTDRSKKPCQIKYKKLP